MFFELFHIFQSLFSLVMFVIELQYSSHLRFENHGDSDNDNDDDDDDDDAMTSDVLDDDIQRNVDGKHE